MSSDTDSARRTGGSPWRDPVGEWMFSRAWQRVGAPASSGSEAPTTRGARWLVLSDQSGIGRALGAVLESQGDRCVLLEHGPAFARLGPERFQIEPTDAEQMRVVLKEARAGGAPCRGVIHLWSLDATPLEAATEESLDVDLGRGSVSALHLAQALLQGEWRELPRLWLVTRGAQAIRGDASLAMTQTPLWGIGRALSREHPGLGCVLVDLHPVPSPDDVQALLREIRATDGEDQVGLRPEGRFAARLTRLRTPPIVERPRLGEDATYAITGAFGPLGLSAAAWMVAHGARHLALVDRGNASGQALSAIARLEAQGARVERFCVDVCRHEDAARLIAELEQRMPPLEGVAHAAELGHGTAAPTLDAASLRAAVGPVVLGALNLHRLTSSRALDFFLLFAASPWASSSGQGHAAAASAFLEAIAHHRRRHGLPALSVDWLAPPEVGHTEVEGSARPNSRSIQGLTPDEVMMALERLWSGPAAQAALFKLELPRGLEARTRANRSPYWSVLRREAEEQRSVGWLRPELEQMAPGDRTARLERHVAAVLQDLLGGDLAQIDRHDAFPNLRLDSRLILGARNRLEIDLGERLPATLLFAYPTLAALTEHLLGRMALAEAAPAPGSPQAALDAQVARMSEEEVEADVRSMFARWSQEDRKDG